MFDVQPPQGHGPLEVPLGALRFAQGFVVVSEASEDVPTLARLETLLLLWPVRRQKELPYVTARCRTCSLGGELALRTGLAVVVVLHLLAASWG